MPEERAGGAVPRLICDVMLGRLARWLRALGHDAAYDSGADDRTLVRRAVRERRLLITRDRGIAAAPAGARILLLQANDTPGQLRETLAALGAGPRPEPFTRCVVCNARLRRARAGEIEARVPLFVRSTHKGFRACRLCGRVYWPGTHRREMARAFAAAMPPEVPSLRAPERAPPRSRSRSPG